MAATSRIISVTSCSASHTNCKKVLGFLGGIKFCPNTVFRFSMSAGCPLRPGKEKQERRRKCILFITFYTTFYLRKLRPEILTSKRKPRNLNTGGWINVFIGVEFTCPANQQLWQDSVKVRTLSVGMTLSSLSGVREKERKDVKSNPIKGLFKIQWPTD